MEVSWLHFFISVFGTFVTTVVAMHLALIPWRNSKGGHWTERARLLWPARKAGLGVLIACILSSGMLDRQVGIGPGFWGVIAGFVAGNFVSTRQIEPRYTFRVWIAETFWSMLVQFGVVGIFIWLMNTMPDNFRLEDWLRIGAGVLAMLVIATGVWLPLFQLFPQKPCAQEERLREIVREMSAHAGLAPRWVFYSRSPSARAAALVHVRSIVVTSRLMEVLDDDELRTIILHELAHLKEGLAVRLSRLVPLFSLVGIAFIKPVMHHFEAWGLLALAGGMLALLKLAGRIARRMENHADDAATHGTVDPAKYARALEKIYEANQLPAVMRSNRMTHPHLYDRMLAAGVTPEYPRPARPAFVAWPGWAALLIPVLLFSSLIGKKFYDLRSKKAARLQRAQ